MLVKITSKHLQNVERGDFQFEVYLLLFFSLTNHENKNFFNFG